MSVSIKSPTSTTGSIQLNGSDVLTIESDNSVDIDSGTLHVDAANNRVGIGTSSPSEITGTGLSQLVVGNNAGNNGVIVNCSSSGDSAYSFAVNNAKIGRIGYDYLNNMTFQTNNAERMRIDSSGNLKFDSGYGSVATAYGCRAWVNFNGTGTVAIRDSGNVSSITDNNVGDYRVNFSTAMPDTNYCVTGSCQGVGGSDIVDFGSFGFSGSPQITPTTSQVAIGTFAYSGSGVDTAIVSVAVFR